MRENGRKMKFQSNVKLKRIELPDPDVFLPLVIRHDVQAVLNYLNQFPAIVNVKDKQNGNIGLHIASSKGYTQLVSVLLSRGSHINTQDIFGNTALHYAVDHSRVEIIQMLISANAIVNIQDYRGNTPLHIACTNNDYESVKVLLTHNADPEVKDFANRSPLDKTTLPSIKVLIEKKIAAIHGGDQEQLSQTVNWLSFGVGLGVGMGMAMAKQQAFLLENERKRVEDQEKRRKKLLQEHNAYNQVGNSESSTSIVLHKPRNNLTSAGANVIGGATGVHRQLL